LQKNAASTLVRSFGANLRAATVLGETDHREGPGPTAEAALSPNGSSATSSMPADPRVGGTSGGLGPATILSRHFRTPAPLVIDGREIARIDVNALLP